MSQYTFDVYSLDRSKWHSFTDYDTAKKFYNDNSEYLFFRVYNTVTGDHVATADSMDAVNKLAKELDLESSTLVISSDDVGINLRFGAGQPVVHLVDPFQNEDEYWLDQINRSRSEDLVDTNLKTAAARNKPKLSDVPPVALFALGAAMSDGASKYGRFNWRSTGSTSSVFYDAIIRHLADWYNGEDFAHDSKIHHLGHIMASCAILLDSELQGKLNDDRDKSNPTSVARNPSLWKTE